ncbi:MAG TPA: PKD domain-containing protein [Phycisphaerales bacterium]
MRRAVCQSWSVRIPSALVLVAGSSSALAQLGAFPWSTPTPTAKTLPVSLETAIASASGGSGTRASMIRAKAVRALETAPMCFSNDTTPELWAKVLADYELRPPTLGAADPFEDRFTLDTFKWGPAGSSGGGFFSGTGLRANLTYSFAPDNTAWGLSGTILPQGFSDMEFALDLAFGDRELGKEYIRQAIANWRRYGGITYTEVADAGIPMDTNSTRRNNVGDIRFGGLFWGINGILAYNGFPTTLGVSSVFGGGDMCMNTAYFNEGARFSNPDLDYRNFRNVIAHEHGHGLGFIHQIPCVGTKLMEPQAAVITDMVQLDDRRGVNRNYGDRYSGNHSLLNAVNLGTLSSPARSLALRDISTNGFFDGGTNPTGTDYFKFTLSQSQQVTINVNPTGESYETGQQASQCTGTTTLYNSKLMGDLAFRLLDANGNALTTVNAAGVGVLESLTTTLGAGTYHVQVWDNNAANATGGSNPNTIVQMYDLELIAGAGVFTEPYANAGLAKRVRANTTAYFMGDINSAPTENRVPTTISRYEWDLDGDGVFETGVLTGASAPKPTFTYVSNGTYNVTLRVVDSNGNAGTDTLAVTVFGATTSLTGSAQSSSRGRVVPFTLNGKNLKNLSNASMVTVSGSGVTVTGTPVRNVQGTQVTGLSYVIASNAALGGRTVSVSNADGSANAALLTVTAPACPGDLNLDGFVDDADFQVFVVAYDVLLCSDVAMAPACPSDLDGDALVNDADFSVFAAAYDTLLCP